MTASETVAVAPARAAGVTKPSTAVALMIERRMPGQRAFGNEV